MMFDPINSSKLLVVEGDDEEKFFGHLLRHESIENVHIQNVHGGEKFPKHISSLHGISGYANVRQIAFVKDAERDAAHVAFTQILTSFQQALAAWSARTRPPMDTQWQLPSKAGEVKTNADFSFGIFIMPNNKDQGTLETLCLEAVKHRPVSGMVETFLCDCRTCHKSECATQAQQDTVHDDMAWHWDKRKVQAYMAAEPIKKFSRHLGLAAKNGTWPFGDIAFTPLRTFLHQVYQ